MSASDFQHLDFEPATRAHWSASNGSSAFVQYFGRSASTAALGVRLTTVETHDDELFSQRGYFSDVDDAELGNAHNESHEDAVSSRRMTSRPEPIPISVLVAGAKQSGKANLIKRLCPSEALDGEPTHGGLDFYLKSRKWTDHLNVKLQMWRASSSPDYSAMIDAHLPRANTLMIAIDLATDRSTSAIPATPRVSTTATIATPARGGRHAASTTLAMLEAADSAPKPFKPFDAVWGEWVPRLQANLPALTAAQQQQLTRLCNLQQEQVDAHEAACASALASGSAPPPPLQPVSTVIIPEPMIVIVGTKVDLLDQPCPAACACHSGALPHPTRASLTRAGQKAALFVSWALGRPCVYIEATSSDLFIPSDLEQVADIDSTALLPSTHDALLSICVEHAIKARLNAVLAPLRKRLGAPSDVVLSSTMKKTSVDSVAPMSNFMASLSTTAALEELTSPIAKSASKSQQNGGNASVFFNPDATSQNNAATSHSTLLVTAIEAGPCGTSMLSDSHDDGDMWSYASAPSALPSRLNASALRVWLRSHRFSLRGARERSALVQAILKAQRQTITSSHDNSVSPAPAFDLAGRPVLCEGWLKLRSSSFFGSEWRVLHAWIVGRTMRLSESRLGNVELEIDLASSAAAAAAMTATNTQDSDTLTEVAGAAVTSMSSMFSGWASSFFGAAETGGSSAPTRAPAAAAPALTLIHTVECPLVHPSRGFCLELSTTFTTTKHAFVCPSVAAARAWRACIMMAMQ